MKSAVPYLQVTAAMLIVGSFVIVNKILVRTFPVFLASELRLLIGAIIMTLLLLAREGRFPALTKKDWVVLLLQSFIGVFLFSFFMLYGLTYTTALESGIITSMTPVMVGLISLLFFRERLRWNQTAGIVCAVLGALAINIFGGLFNASWSLHTLWGNLLVLLAVAGEGVFLTFGKLVSKQVSPIAITTMTSLLGSALFMPFAAYNAASFDFTAVSATEWLLVLYTGVVITVIATILLNQGMKKISAGSSATFTALMPISTIIMSALFLHEPIFWYHFLGIAFVFVGIAFATLPSSRTKRGAPAATQTKGS
ncbi:DMT family transporter [Paenibacillus sp. MZ04-78.2]|uniref:DMT family transporter n=1 Tax=Paenibacillus sp. MZ04-78.2 TaxID=2962034 RepID=UPI0020B81341|nr:DMT family transporter [Paenibacillus sp. MZ04-78.2]MCP3774414.1 DMT family transporter [Paenibacillus sp. MZ04-78.2]